METRDRLLPLDAPPSAEVQQWSEAAKHIVEEWEKLASFVGAPSELTHGPEGMKRFATAMRTAFPDLQTTHEDTISQGDKVVIRWTLSGTHTGPWLGMALTGRSFRVSGIDIFRILDGKLVELWQEGDTLGFLQQLGVIEAAEQSAR